VEGGKRSVTEEGEATTTAKQDSQEEIMDGEGEEDGGGGKTHRQRGQRFFAGAMALRIPRSQGRVISAPEAAPTGKGDRSPPSLTRRRLSLPSVVGFGVHRTSGGGPPSPSPNSPREYTPRPTSPADATTTSHRSVAGALFSRPSASPHASLWRRDRDRDRGAPSVSAGGSPLFNNHGGMGGMAVGPLGLAVLGLGFEFTAEQTELLHQMGDLLQAAAELLASHLKIFVREFYNVNPVPPVPQNPPPTPPPPLGRRSTKERLEADDRFGLEEAQNGVVVADGAPAPVALSAAVGGEGVTPPPQMLTLLYDVESLGRAWDEYAGRNFAVCDRPFAVSYFRTQMCQYQLERLIRELMLPQQQ